MFEKPITAQRFARWGVVAAIVALVYVVLHYLSAVLLPFFVAWLFAYLLYPVVKFIQFRMRVRIRAISIILAMVAFLAVMAGVLWLVIPPMIDQFTRFCDLAARYMHHVTHIDDFPAAIRWWLMENSNDVQRYLRSENFSATLKEVAPQLFGVLGKAVNTLMSIVTSFITLLYMFFILHDYEYLSEKWISIFPKSARPFWAELMKDVEHALNNYIRGQGMVSLIMGVLFCIGFTIIGFPMALGMGLLIGITNMVPYLHTFALVPAAFLAAIKAADTGESFWMIMVSVVAVFCVVQLIIEAVVIPMVMKHRLGLNPAVLLLSLSVWGALLGFMGLIIALPATTIIITYWKKYVTKNE